MKNMFKFIWKYIGMIAWTAIGIQELVEARASGHWFIPFVCFYVAWLLFEREKVKP